MALPITIAVRLTGNKVILTVPLQIGLKAIELKPDYAEAYNNRGVAHGNKGNFDRAIEDFNIAMQLKPDYADAYNNRGEAYNRQRRDRTCH